jgi:hypothetical protein
VSENADFVTTDEFIDEWVARGCFLGWVFIYMPIGKDPDLNLMPTPEQRRRLGQRVRYFRKTRPIFIADFWNDGDYVDGCIAAAKKYLHINCHGDVEPCVFAHFAVDNIKGKSLKEVINSPFFQKIQARQPFNHDHRLPCMLIDNPEILREVVEMTGARPTHPGAESLVTTLAPKVDDYARRMREELAKEDAAKTKHVANAA